jgi:hypothetical protein
MIDYKIPNDWITIVDTSKISSGSKDFLYNEDSLYQSTGDIGASIVQKLESGVKIVVCRNGEAVLSNPVAKKTKMHDAVVQRYAIVV